MTWHIPLPNCSTSFEVSATFCRAMLCKHRLYAVMRCLSLDFSKAFDTVRHSTLMEKLAQLHLPDYVYNWLADFFTGHSHCTVYHGQASTLKSIAANIIRGSGIGRGGIGLCGQRDYASDLKGEGGDFWLPTVQVRRRHLPRHPSQQRRLAGDRDRQHRDVGTDKQSDAEGSRRRSSFPTLDEGVRLNHHRQRRILPVFVTSLKILGVTMTNGLSASGHVRDVIRSCAQTLYALRVLRVHGMCLAALQAIFRLVAIAKLELLQI